MLRARSSNFTALRVYGVAILEAADGVTDVDLAPFQPLQDAARMKRVARFNAGRGVAVLASPRGFEPRLPP